MHWSVDEERFKKRDPKQYQRWHLLNLINYGLRGEKINLRLLTKLWPEIKDQILDPKIKTYLARYIINQNG